LFVSSPTPTKENPMGKIIVAQFVTLDGVTEDPDGSGGTPYGGWAFRHPEAVAGDKFRLGPLLDTGVTVLGRTTWQLFAGLFPQRTDDFSLKLTAMEKLVASRSLHRVDAWANSTLLRGDLVAEVQRRRSIQDVVVTGSGSVVDALVAHDLVDQYRLLVFPTVLGKGRRLFDAASAPLHLQLAVSEDVSGGVLHQIYDRD
jgi:dihydrofolate reductase